MVRIVRLRANTKENSKDKNSSKLKKERESFWIQIERKCVYNKPNSLHNHRYN